MPENKRIATKQPAIVDKSKPKEALAYITIGIEGAAVFKDTDATPARKRRK